MGDLSLHFATPPAKCCKEAVIGLVKAMQRDREIALSKVKNKNIEVVMSLIRCLDIESLRNWQVVADLVRAFGIVKWGGPMGDEDKFKNPTPGMAGIYQTPNQIAKALVYLSELTVNSYLEIGVFQGGNFIFVSEYLRRFNPQIQCTGIDPTDYLNEEIKEVIDANPYMTFRAVTSAEIAGKEFDLVLIDGDHSAEWVARDWENVGRHAKYCMVHDIQDAYCPDVVWYWGNIKGDNPVTFLDNTSAGPLMGIGIICNDAVVRS